MKRFLAFAVILSFLAIVVVGPMVSMYFGEHGHGQCLASLAERTDCPAKDNILSLISFHFGAIQNLVNIFASASQSVFLALLLSCFSIIFLIFSPSFFEKLIFVKVSEYAKRLEKTVGDSEKEFLHWLKIKCRSPSFCR